MKLIQKLVFRFSPALLGVTLAGCSSPTLVSPLSGGYEEVGHPRRFASTPADQRVSFQYRAPNGKTQLIWPSLYGVNEVVKGEVAIFVGDKAFVQPDPDNPRAIKPRLFAVKSPALPLDITDEVLWYWSKTSGKDFATAQERLSFVTPGEKDGRLVLLLEFWANERDWPDKATLPLDWTQVSDLMREVQAKGTVRKDLRWGTSYIEK